MGRRRRPLRSARPGRGDGVGDARRELRREARRPPRPPRAGRRADPAPGVELVPLEPRGHVGRRRVRADPCPAGAGAALVGGRRRRWLRAGSTSERTGRATSLPARRSAPSRARPQRPSDVEPRGGPRRASQQRQVHGLQRTHRGGRRSRAAHVLDRRDEPRRGRCPRPAPGGAHPALGLRARSCPRRSGSSISQASCAAHRTARGSGTSSSARSARRMRCSTSCGAFSDETVAHPAGSVDPLGDVETVELELAFADLAAIERRYERVAKAAKGGDRDAVAEGEALEAIRAALEAGRPARSAGVEMPASVDLLTAKPTLYLANVDDSGNAADVAAARGVRRRARRPVRPGEREDRGGAARAARRRCPRLPGRPRDRVARARPPHAGDLRAARPDPVLHDRAQGDARPGRSGAARTPRPPPAASTPTSPAGSSARRSSSGTGSSRPARRSRPSGAAGSASRGATTSSRTATS